MNLFTNVMTIAFSWFNQIAQKRFQGMADPATGETLTERNKKFELGKVLEMPWTFWTVLAFSLFETSTASVFQSNATELAEQRFNTDSITAGWYTSVLQYAGKSCAYCFLQQSLTYTGFFVVPCVGMFIDVLGNRISLSMFYIML